MASTLKKLKAILVGKEESEESNSSKWPSLPDDVLELILKRLRLKDYLTVAAVCSSWRVTVSNAIANKHCLPLPEPSLSLLKPKEPASYFRLGYLGFKLQIISSVQYYNCNL